MKPLQIAVVGAGAIGRVHIRVVQASQQCVLSAIVDPTEAARQMAQARGVTYFENLTQLLQEAQPDGVILATPNAMHVTQALQCIEAGVAVLVEKPIAHTVAEAIQLVKVIHSKGPSTAKVLIGHHRAHSPIMALAKKVVDEGQLGRLVSVIGSAMFYKPDHYFTDAPWRTVQGGGPVLINLIHEIHNLRMLCGDIVEIQALASNAVRGFEVEDTAAVNFRFGSGVLGTFLLSDTSASARSWEQTSQENKDYASYDDEDCYVVAGTLGSLSIPSMRLKKYATLEDRSWFNPFQVKEVALQREDPLPIQLQHFIDVIANDATPLVSAQDGLQNLRVVEAIQEAIQTGQLVKLKSEFLGH